jgi:site-specific DNA-methyltransferase (adenine-specific)
VTKIYVDIIKYSQRLVGSYLLFKNRKKEDVEMNEQVKSKKRVVEYGEVWTGEELYQKYGLTQEEIEFIESMIRPME